MPRRTLLTAALVILSAGGGYLAASAAEAPAPRGYLVAEIDVTDAQAYAPYAGATPPIMAKHGARYLARGGATVAKEGAPPAPRVAIVEFPSLAAARAYYESPDYQAILPIRRGASTGRLFLVEGVAPPAR